MNLHKVEHAAAVLTASHGIRFCVFMEHPPIIHKSGVLQFQAGEHPHDGIRRENTMRIEADAITANGDRQKQRAAWRQNSRKLGGCLGGPLGLYWIAIPPQSNMLDDVQAGQRVDSLCADVQTCQVSLPAFQTRQQRIKRSVVNENRIDERTNHTDHLNIGTNVHMRGWLPLGQFTGQPGSLVKIMGIERCLMRGIPETGIAVNQPDPLPAGAR